MRIITYKINVLLVESSYRGVEGILGMRGWGNGYVTIPKDHPCYMMDYDDIHDKYKIDVHGGLTYSGWGFKPLLNIEQREWIIGFDTAHYNDTLERWPEHEVRKEAERLKEQILYL